jgi:RNA polymerase sigma factor (sigma-70 family)
MNSTRELVEMAHEGRVVAAWLPRSDADGPGVQDNRQQSDRLVSLAVKRAQGGDRSALGFLYARYADDVYGYVHSIVHDAREAEDVTEQVFAGLIHLIDEYEARNVPFFAWMLHVARNLAMDRLSRQRVIPAEKVRASDEGGGHSSSEPAHERPARRHLIAALGPVRDARACGTSPETVSDGDRHADGSLGGVDSRAALQADLARGAAAPTPVALTNRQS